MNEEVQFFLDEAEDQMQKAISHLETELAKIRAGRASTQMLDGVYVEYYGTNAPLNNVAGISTPDPRTLVVQPFEKAMLVPIEKAIMAANLGFNPQNDGSLIRISVPPLTEERRKELVKVVKAEVEQTKVVVVCLHFAGIVDLKAHLAENVENLAHRGGGRMQLANRLGSSW